MTNSKTALHKTLLITAGVVLGAILHRLKGGGYFSLGGTQIARAMWAISSGIYCWACGAPGWVPVFIAMGQFLGPVLVGHSRFQYGGNYPDDIAPDTRARHYRNAWVAFFFT